jgi:hypothetical protein
MKLESKKQKTIPTGRFLLRMGKFLIFTTLMVVFSLGFGVAGYHHFGNLNWIDSLHMASMILTGMGPVTEMKTEAAKVFSSFYALYSGIAFLSITAVFFAPIIHRVLHILHVEK